MSTLHKSKARLAQPEPLEAPEMEDVNLFNSDNFQRFTVNSVTDFDAVYHKFLRDLSQFLTRDFVDVIQHMWSLKLCPIQTPVAPQTHHAHTAQIFEQFLGNGLKDIFAHIEEERKRLEPIYTRSKSDQINLPDISTLQKFAEHYKSFAEYSPLLDQILYCLHDIRSRCENLWAERKSLHQSEQYRPIARFAERAAAP